MTAETFVALAGNPNSGKTTLFNRLTGLTQKVGNYPGITVERRSGRAKIGQHNVTIVDVPGAYSLVARSRDEAIAFEVITGQTDDPKPALTILVVDASNLHRNLYLGLSILELGAPCVVALNMMDDARAAGCDIDHEALAEALGVPVVPIVARNGEGIDALHTAIGAAIESPPTPYERRWKLDDAGEAAIAHVAEDADEATAIWTLTSVASSEDAPDGELTNEARAALVDVPEIASQVIDARYAVANDIVEACERRTETTKMSRTDKVDAILLHPIFGVIAFMAVMAVVFQSIFAWASPLMDLIEVGIARVQVLVFDTFPNGALRDLVADGVVGGVGNVIVFVPQIAILFLFITILEDTGYLARAAFISDRLMARAGLHGRAFVPLLSGFACAVPAIMATRSIETPKDRLVTILVTPLVSCSARLPVYILIIAALFSTEEKIGGVISIGGLLMLLMYVLSVVFTIGVAFVLKRTLLASPTPPLVLELPPYRAPEWRSVLRRVYDRCKVFVRDAGTVILACSIVLWALLYFPRNPDLGFDPAKDLARLRNAFSATMIDAHTEARKAEVQALAKRAEEKIRVRVSEARLAKSFGGRIGHAMEPLIEPLGYDWKIGIGLLASFAAREVFVSTMGLVYGIGEVDEEDSTLRNKISKNYTPLTGLSLMIFFLLAAQCMSTIAVVRRETRSWRWPMFMLVYMNVLAWVASLIVYQGGKLLGFT